VINSAMVAPGARTSESVHIPSLDGIRAAAVMLVFLAHAGLNERVPGNFGVTAFFFLSGYLITTLLRMEFDRTGGVSLRAFYLRRILRIFPPMYLVLGCASLITVAGLMEGSVHLDAFAAQVFYLSNYYIVQNGWWDGRAPGSWIYWSLAVEEHFYLVFPLAYLFLRRWTTSNRRQLLILAAICAAVLAWRLELIIGLGASHDRTYVATDTRIDSILFGCMLAVYGNPILEPTRIAPIWWKLVLLPAGVLALLISFLVQTPVFADTLRYTVQGLALLPLFAVAIRFHDWGMFRILNWRWVRFTGALSYSIYLMHPTVLFAVHQWTPWHPLVQGMVSLGLTLGLAAVMYRFIEQPCARLRKRLSHVMTSSAPRSLPTFAFQHVTLKPRDYAEPKGPAVTPASSEHVSVVICTRNRPDLIGNAVASVLANDYPRFDVTVVDQSDDQITARIVKALSAKHTNLRYVHSRTPGLSRAYNTGIRETTGPILAFTDDDCVAPPDWIDAVVEAFDADAAADMLYGQVLLPASLVGHGGVVPTLPIDRPERLSHRDGFRIYGMGANFAARRRLFERVGGFDEALGGGGPLKSSQDFDLQYRVYRAGATVLLCPSVKVDHYGYRSPEQWPGTLRAYGFGDGAFYFKHVRCGDLYVLNLLLQRLIRLTAREMLIRIGLRRRPSQAPYLRSCLEGIWQSLRYRVDRQQRLYRASEA